MKTKICQQCNFERDFELFNPKTKNSVCKECRIINIDTELKCLHSQNKIPTKTCHICKLNKDVSLFYNSLWLLLGRESKCKDCSDNKRKNQRKKQKELNLLCPTQNIAEKQCSTCLKILDISNFTKATNCQDGFIGTCKLCRQNAPKIIITEKFCPDCQITKLASDFTKNKQSRDNLNFICKDCSNSKQKVYHRNRDRKKVNEKMRQRYKTDPHYRAKCNLRRRIWQAIKSQGAFKSNSTALLVGLAFDKFLLYLESLFEPGMTWENYTKYGWHIDHIIPCVSFDLSQESEQLKCFHYSNLMPRWATTAIAKAHGSNQIGNLNKNDRILKPFDTGSKGDPLQQSLQTASPSQLQFSELF